MSKPTPRPWSTEQQGETTFIVDQYGDVILAVDCNPVNAAHIVKCVNLHEELVEALKAAQEMLINECMPSSPPASDPRWAQIAGALDKAGAK